MNILLAIAFGIVWLAVVVLKARNGQPLNASHDEYIPVNRMDYYSGFSERNLKIAYTYLAGWMMKQNNRNSREKMQFIQLYFRSYFKGQDRVSEQMSDALRYDTDLESVARWLNRVFSDKKEKRVDALRFLVALGMEDGLITQNEYDALVQLTKLLHIERHALDALIDSKKQQRYSQEQAREEAGRPVKTESQRRKAMAVLELSEDHAETETIKSTYRKLVKLYHPDKFMQDSPQAREKAAARFREVQEAYDYLMKDT